MVTVVDEGSGMSVSILAAAMAVVPFRGCLKLSHRAKLPAYVGGLLVGFAAHEAVAGPLPVITALASEGMAPFTAHLHGLDSTLDAGNTLTARYEWTFGEVGSEGNELVGW